MSCAKGSCSRKRLEAILARYKGVRSELIPLLQDAQAEFGYLPKDIMGEIADFLRLPASTVFGVSTFYAQFKFVPMGKKVIQVCRGTACHVRGADKIVQEFERQLCIKEGETTSDLEYTLETVACVGACALAPTLMINREVQGKMTTQKIRDIVKKQSGDDEKKASEGQND